MDKDKDKKREKSPILYTRLVGGVEDDSVKQVMADIDTANSRVDVREIVFTISSRGGRLYPAFALYDHIKRSKKPIDIIAEGYCMSAAIMILQAARKRLSTQHTSFMIHPSSYATDEKKPYSEFLTMVEEYKRNHDLFVKLTIEKSGVSKDQFEKLYNPRRYLTPQEAIKIGKNGLIDEIIS